MTLSKREKLGIMFALVVIGLVLFFTVGRSKENYRGRTKWADKAYQLPWHRIGGDPQASYDRVMRALDRKKEFRQEKVYFLNKRIQKAREDGKIKLVQKLEAKRNRVQNK